MAAREEPETPADAANFPTTRHATVGAWSSRSRPGWWARAGNRSLALIVGLGVLGLIWLLARPLAMLVMAIVLAEALAPVAHWLARWLPRTLAIVLVYIVLLLAVALLAWFLIPRLLNEVVDLATVLPERLDQLRGWLANWPFVSSEQVSRMLQQRIDTFFQSVLALPMTLLTVLIDVLLVVVISIYWLIGQPTLYRFVLSLFPDERRERVGEVLVAVGHSMGGYIRGVAINAAIVSTLTYIGLTLVGLDFALSLALVAGLSEFIPVVGPFFAAIPAVGVALLDSVTTALIVLVLYTALQQFEGNVLMPKIMQAQTDVPPVLGLFALLAGAYLGGILGALVALPLAAALFALALHVGVPLVRQWTGAAQSKATGDDQPVQQPEAAGD